MTTIVGDAAGAATRLDRVVLNLLLGSDETALWTVAEVERELGGEDDLMDAFDRLHCVGLVHRLQDFVFVTRAARRADELSV